MSDINFLENQKHGDDQKSKDKSEQKEKPVWSDPEKKAKGQKSSAFSFLPFLNKEEPVDKNSAPIIDKNKIKQGREEILNLIKRHESSKPPLKEKSKNFLKTIAEKLKSQPGYKEVLIDYQRVYNQEKEHKNQADKLFSNKPAAESKPTAQKPKNNWFTGLIEPLKIKIIALSARKSEATKIIKLSKAEEIKPQAVKPPEPVRPIIKLEKRPDEAKEVKIKETEPAQKGEIKQRVLETNLIQGELITFFDWRAKIIFLISAILTPIFVIGAIYYGLVFYQKSSQAKNLLLAQRFAEIEKNITEEESGLKEIYDFQSKLKIVSKIFEQHLYWTNFFKFLEDNTIKNVYFRDFKGDTSGVYVMDALAADYGNISEQVNVFRNNKKITAVEADGGQMAEGDIENKSLVSFILNFSVLKNIFTE